MSSVVNTFEIKNLASVSSHAPAHVLQAIHSASEKSGVSFSYLVQQAQAESSFDPAAKARTSSATGLYQFIDSTWMQMVERYGADYGLDTDGMSKKDILALRKDPEASSFMAAAFASENEKVLNANWGGDVGATELYFAHFLGAGGASSFLKAMDANPFQSAADLFPAAARSNRAVFYDSQSGRPRTLAQVYNFFDKKFSIEEEKAVPTPPSLPQQKKPGLSAEEIAANDLVPRESADSLIMTRLDALRKERERNGYGQITGAQTYQAPHGFGIKSTERQPTFPMQAVDFQAQMPLGRRRMPLYSLVAQPVDLMLLSQNAPLKGSDKS